MIKTKKQVLLTNFTAESLSDNCYWASKGRTSRIEKLEADEIAAIYYLFHPNERPKSDKEKLTEFQQQAELKRLRSIILADAQYIGLYNPNNWNKFNAFMKHTSVLKKPLNAYKIADFPQLIKQFKS
ncbi:hypothetical protein, partial [Tenacibaculum piscium]